jgi:hypothetical protein
MLNRRLVLSLPLVAVGPARAHHGWSSFDQTRPLYLEGKAAKVHWANPHVEVQLEVPAADVKLPPDLATRVLPAQTSPVEGAALLKAAQLPTRKDRRWEIELAPISRMNAWAVPEIKAGDTLGLLGFTLTGERGAAVLRVEYLFFGGKTYGLRSSPA